MAKNATIGELRHKITIKEDTGTAETTLNEHVPVWTTLAGGEQFAKVEPLTGQELVEAAQLNAMTTHRVTCRYVANVTPKNQINYAGRTLGILAVINRKEQNLWLELLCKEYA